MPRVIYKKLRFVDHRILSAISGVGFVEKCFRGNGAADPVVDVGGGSPSSWSIYSAQYIKYNVLASKISCRVQLNNGSSGIPYICGVSHTNEITSVFGAVGMLDRLVESGKWKYRILRPVPPTVTAQPTAYLKAYCSTKRALPTGYKDSDAYSGMSAVPLKEWYWLFECAPCDATTGVINLALTTTITYYVKFFDPQDSATYQI